MAGTTSGAVFTKSGEDVHMRIFQGKSLQFEVIWGGSAPIDVTGYGVLLQIRDLSKRLMLELSTANGKVQVGGSDGRLVFNGTDGDTRAITSTGNWELELTTPGGDIYRALAGTATPVEEIAK